jgi:NADH-quinone oxidoreductase subunit A
MVNFVLFEYFPLILFGVVALSISVLLVVLSLVFGVRRPDAEKLSAYECGFNPFGDSRQIFEIKFYILAILFIVFDVEMTLLFPLVVYDVGGSILPIFFIFSYLFILFIGFLYEWHKGALVWTWE